MTTTVRQREQRRGIFRYGRSTRSNGWVCPVCLHKWGLFRESCPECGFERDDARDETMTEHDALRESDAVDWE